MGVAARFPCPTFAAANKTVLRASGVSNTSPRIISERNKGCGVIRNLEEEKGCEGFDGK